MARESIMWNAMQHFIESTNQAEHDGKISNEMANKIRHDGIELLGRICDLLEEYATDMKFPQSSTCYVLASALLAVIKIYPDEDQPQVALVAARFLLDAVGPD